MKPITEYLQKGHLDNTVKRGIVKPEDLKDGDYYVIDVNADWKDLYEKPQMSGKCKFANNKVIHNYFNIGFGPHDYQGITVHADCGLAGCQLRYPTPEEQEELERIEYELEPYIVNGKQNQSVGKYFYKTKKIELNA